MIRSLYRALLSLHPPEFRDQFGDEMLWIFDETRNTEGSLSLLGDGFASVLRQWVVGYEIWKVMPMVIYWLTLLDTMLTMLARRGFR